ncbi:hypothetical protein B9Z55_023055 [Caenorhabditis nigoni]|uniref:Uncharacterized protein n=1 Tax=Caenorhabditis nigoni TaxID=1611254 RepID=A0A2G5SNJ4_9PELO|nr:hypothetical protein B9Z55_023055 [Caenorhabditis nigoni]
MNDRERVQCLYNALVDDNYSRIVHLMHRIHEASGELHIHRQAIAAVMTFGTKSPNYASYLHKIGAFIPIDMYRQERVNILAHVPDWIRQQRNLHNKCVLTITSAITDTTPYLYSESKRTLGAMILPLAHSCVHNQLDPFITDRQRIDILRYLEKYVKPDWNDEQLRIVDSTFCTLAKRVQVHDFPEFMETVHASENYCYHALLASLTHLVDRNLLRAKDAMKFMIKKHHLEDREEIGLLGTALKATIEEEFLFALVKTMNVYNIDRLLHELIKTGTMDRSVIEIVAERHIKRLRAMMAQAPATHALIYLTRQCALTKYCAQEKNAVLQKAVEFGEQFVEFMDELQKRVLCKTLATLSFPKRECSVQGGDKLFVFLFSSLMDYVPNVPHYFVVDAAYYHSVLVCLDNLYNLDRRDRLRMTSIDANWKDKLKLTRYWHLVTSQNLKHVFDKAYERGEFLRARRFRRLQNAVCENGKLLVHFIGHLRDAHLPLIMPHLYEHDVIFAEELYTTAFNTLLQISFTQIPLPGTPVLRRDPPTTSAERDDDESDDNSSDENESADDDSENEEEEHQSDGDSDSADEDSENEEKENQSDGDSDNEDSEVEEDEAVEDGDVQNQADAAASDDDGEESNEDSGVDEQEVPPILDVNHAVVGRDEEIVVRLPRVIPRRAWQQINVPRQEFHDPEEDRVSPESANDENERTPSWRWLYARYKTNADVTEALDAARLRRWRRAFSHNDGSIARLNLVDGVLHIREVEVVVHVFLCSILGLTIRPEIYERN